MTTTQVLPDSTAWKTPESWSTGFEPMGATNKMVTYTIIGTTRYVIGFMKRVEGELVRFYSEPLLGSQIATPINGKIEIQQNMPISQREFEFWLFTVTEP